MKTVLSVARWIGCFLVAYLLITTSIILVNRFVFSLGLTPIMQSITVLGVAVIAHYWWRKGFLKFGRKTEKADAPTTTPAHSKFVTETALFFRALGWVAVVMTFASAIFVQPFPNVSELIGMTPLPLSFFVLAWLIELVDLVVTRASRRRT